VNRIALYLIFFILIQFIAQAQDTVITKTGKILIGKVLLQTMEYVNVCTSSNPDSCGLSSDNYHVFFRQEISQIIIDSQDSAWASNKKNKEKQLQTADEEYANNLIHGYLGLGLGSIKSELSINFFVGFYRNASVGAYFSCFFGGGVDDNKVYKNISADYAINSYHDSFTGETHKFTNITFGATYSVSNNIILLSGLSITYDDKYLGFHDEYRILGDGGDYFTNPTSSSSINLNLGIIIPVSNSYGLNFAFDIGKSSSLSFGFNWHG